MWYDVGAKDDPAGRSGFAHLFEHILSRVTRNIPPGELSRMVERGRCTSPPDGISPAGRTCSRRAASCCRRRTRQ
jgi:hypothetical protein